MKLTKEQLATRLNGREIRHETTEQDRLDAKNAGYYRAMISWSSKERSKMKLTAVKEGLFRPAQKA